MQHTGTEIYVWLAVISALLSAIAGLIGIIGIFAKKWGQRVEKSIDTVMDQLKDKVDKTDCLHEQEKCVKCNDRVDWETFNDHVHEGMKGARVLR